MGNFDVGMKNYDNDWFLRYGLSYQDAARCLSDWGVTFIMTQSRYIPMPDSAVESEVKPSLDERYSALDEREFRDALRKEGIECWITVCMFFDPYAMDREPSLIPIGSDGKPMKKIDWYIGIAPSMDKYIELKTFAIAEAVKALDPDGIFMSFTRWPGFWELWTPDRSRADFPEYSFDPYTLDRFSHETGVTIPNLDPVKAYEWIEANVREVWTSWKCKLVKDTIRLVKDTCCQIKPGTRIMLNMLPFGSNYFENAQETTFGQNLEELSEVVDIFEVMTYHQILKRPIDWIPAIGTEVKQRTGRKTICTLQARPLYLDGIHARENRSPAIDVNEFSEAVQAIEASNLDGIVVFVWSDLLEMVMKQNDYHRIDAIREAVDNRRAKGD